MKFPKIDVEIKSKDIETDIALELDPFENDWLNRKGFADLMTKIVKENNNQFVLGLNGQWGEGKTTFINMWQEQLKNEGVPCIYFDAFKYDYVDNVFLSLAIEIIQFAKANKNTEKNDFKEKSQSVYASLLSMSQKIPAINIDNQDFSENENSIAFNLQDQINKLHENTFDKALEQRELFQKFKDSLSELARVSAVEEYPLVIIIDELDRCKPNFAIDVLEKVKHLFSVKNVTFVLSMHEKQITESIKKIYGNGIDAKEYLQKFINLSVTLPRASFSSDKSRNNYLTQSIHRLKLYELPHFSNWLPVLSTLVEYYNLSYRQLNKVLQNIYIYSNICHRDQLNTTCTLLILYISVIHIADSDLTTKIRDNQFTRDDLIADHQKMFNTTDEYNTIQSLQSELEMCLFTNSSCFDSSQEHRKFVRSWRSQVTTESNNVLNYLLKMLETLNS